MQTYKVGTMLARNYFLKNLGFLIGTSFLRNGNIALVFNLICQSIQRILLFEQNVVENKKVWTEEKEPTSNTWSERMAFLLSMPIAYDQHGSHRQQPHGIRLQVTQQRFSVNMWTGKAEDCLVKPYILPARMDVFKYLVYSHEFFLEYLNDVHAHVWQKTWF